MRKTIIAIYGAIILSGCSLNNMVKVADCPDIRGITPPSGKAALVIAETRSYENYDLEDNLNINNYLDRKFIGTINSFSFFVTTVEPGRHYIVASGENYETILLNFEPGKTYYLEQERRMGLSNTRTEYIPVKADRLYNDLNGKSTCYEPDVHNPGRDLDEERFAEVIAAYTKKKGNIPVNEIEQGK